MTSSNFASPRAISLAALILSAATPVRAQGDADRGEALYQGCQDCH